MGGENEAAMYAEIRGLRDSMDAKFDGFAKIIHDMRDWMRRLTDTVERQAENRDRVVGLEHRTGALEMQVEVYRQQLQDTRDTAIRNGVITALATSAITALLGAVAVGVVAFILP